MNDEILLKKIDSLGFKRIDKIYNRLTNEEKDYFDNRYIDSSKHAETLYRLRNNIEIRPQCKHCGGYVEFCRNGYFRDFCSISCSNLSQETKQKKCQTNIKKYGCEFSTQSPIVKERVKLSLNNRTDEEKQKTKEKRLKTTQNWSNEYKVEIHNKMVNTCLERYGTTNGGYTENAKIKIQQTCLKKYGVDNPGKIKESHEKAKKTNIIRYGGNAPICSSEIKEKIKQTNIIRYGGNAPSSSTEIKEKIKQTNIIRYGVDVASKLNETKEKQRNTCLERYGVDTFFKTEKLKKMSNSPETKRKEYETKIKNHTFSTSREEEYLYNCLCNKYGINNVKRQYSSDSYKYNCDFYITTINLYIEYNGSHYHHFHPFDETNKNDIIELNKLKNLAENSERHKNGKKSQYDTIIYVWCILDVKKRKMANINKLNFIELWNKNDIDKFIAL